MFLVLSFLNCGSNEVKESAYFQDTSYEMTFSPCVCKKQEIVLQAKKTIMSQGIKDYEKITTKDIEPELESKIVEEEYDHFLYDFSLEEKPKEDVIQEEYIKAEGKVKQQDLNQYVEKNSRSNRRKTIKASSDYGSKGLEVIKSFHSDRKKRQTVDELSKSKNRPIILYEMKRR
jgi:hypothetical protein